MTGLLDKMNELEAREKETLNELAETPVESTEDTTAEEATAEATTDVAEPKEPKKTAKNGVKFSTGKKKSFQQTSNKIANADKMKKIIDKSKTTKDACPKAAKLHKHLNTVGTDGVSHKDRIEKELKEHAAKVKKIIRNVCFGIIAVGVAIFFGLKYYSGNSQKRSKVNSKPAATKKASSAATQFRFFKQDIQNYVKSDKFNKQEFFTDFDKHIEQYPENKKAAEALKAKLMRLYDISE